ncbi:hypothetical protein HYFRA_00007072 [Hymenoscyphus fraxineus]|uniref:tRNA pseudouridine synthase 1 n=1 Tax=Hymenoscyphus fraxineus TaxID=746836 RepID=A0A9N9PTZ2_9HELO|nr:hypothetical protein HYFRA_00007072 [Hymenoscyphus fraxineus]
MADNPTTTAPAKPDGDRSSRGDRNSNSHNSRPRGQRGGRSQGGRGGRGGQGRGGGGRGRGGGFGANNNSGGRKKDMGRGAYNRNGVDRRKRNEDGKEKPESNEYAATTFTKEEIEAEGRKPKKKVAVLIGYAGSGYKGMQINGSEKTIEGDIFKAFVAAGAISKANADDPKKSTLVRCARTDKGVHAAGNVISLKLIVEEPNIVQKINEHLPPQIRIWGMERTNGSFSCYQSCDSRWYEYLIPTYSFLPPHPKSFLGQKLAESAEKKGVLEQWKSRMEDVSDFWAKAEETYVKPILDEYDADMQEAIMTAIHTTEELSLEETEKRKGKAGKEYLKKVRSAEKQGSGVVESFSPKELVEVKDEEQVQENTVLGKRAASVKIEDEDAEGAKRLKTTQDPSQDEPVLMEVDEAIEETKVEIKEETTTETKEEPQPTENAVEIKPEDTTPEKSSKSILSPLDIAIKRVKAAYIVAKKAYRISPSRKSKVQETLNCYVGTRNFHNYTIQKSFSDPSAKRVIRSFKVGPEPVYINDTEWLSLKVHGQSFMMHQIRKMIAMAALIVRCGSTTNIIQESYTSATISIPKAPGLGLLLERPVFDTYNTQAVEKFQREKIDFDKFKTEMEEFKQREIYDRIFREEERDHQFHTFFHHLDHYRTDFFLWVTAEGIAAARQSIARSEVLNDDDDGEDERPDVNGQDG